ncbi:hypothetical protein K2P96_01860, partial [Patescibacteria group bacterium]|nr:hypothetical protein [Patescibacteria group bacterium]
GGKQIDFEKESKELFERGDFSTTINTYTDMNFTMSKRVRDFFDFDTDFGLLKKSVIFPLIFFRSPSIDVWNKELSLNKRTEMEEYSFDKVKEIVTTVNPAKILIIGIKTYKKLKELLPEIDNEKIVYVRQGAMKPMAITAEYGNKKIFVTIHFSGARINKIDWQGIKDLFKVWIKE